MSGVASKIAQDRAKAAGLGSFNNPIKFADQDFEKLKAECLASKTLFEDEQFKTDQSSLGIEMEGLGPDTEKVKDLEWKRPKEITKDPKFVVGGTESDDVNQGRLSNCWFLGAVICLTNNTDYLSHIVPLDQSFDKDYAGIFHFKFWHYGQWVDVVIDDRLPTKNNKLLFASSKSSNEFWTALLEKAYAKINGSYEAIIRGYILESLEDFTGGLSEIISTSQAGADFFQKIQRALIHNCFLGCASPPKGTTDRTKFSPSIAKGHMYTISRVEEVTYGENQVAQLIRVRNPWGFSEWNGPWSDKSEMWNNVDPIRKAELNKDKDEGEFWMAFSDFLVEYNQIEICDVTMSEVCSGDNYNWCLTEFNGEWKKGSTAGGKDSFDTFWINPQYRITLEASDGDTSKKCPIVVALMQKDRRKLKIRLGAYQNLGFYIYKLGPSDTLPLGKEFFKKNQCVASLTTFMNMREVLLRLELLPGDYVIVTTTKSPEEEADFYLRVFTKKPTGGQEPGRIKLMDIYQPVITPETDSEFDIVKAELQKGEFNENEVKDMLNKMLAKDPELKSSGLTIQPVRDLIKLMDVDNTKTLSIDEFKQTWLKVANYWNIFQSADADKSSTLDATEFRNAMMQSGFNFDVSILNAIVDKLAHDSLNLDFNVFISITANMETSFNPELKSSGLTIKPVRDLIKLMDVDNTKTLSIDEFKKTWLKVANYWNIFQSADADKSSTLDATEFRNAMMQAGFNFDISILNAIVDKLAQDSLNLDFNVFISITANMETSFNMYNLLNPDKGGSINLSLDEWLLTKLA